MSKKKPTAPIPLTGVVTITTEGRTTLAMKASHRGEDIEVRTGLSRCRPGDVYSEYEGARIALARLYGVDPFPKFTEDGSAPQEKGHWEPATQENCRVGSRVKVVSATFNAGKYHNGQEGRVHSYVNYRDSGVHVVFDGNEDYTKPFCWLSELEVWVPDAPEARKTPAPSFRVGDIVRLREGKNVFSPKLKGKVGKVYEVWENPDLWITHYTIVLNDGSGAPTRQYCSEWSGQPAPLELVYREPGKGGEKA